MGAGRRGADRARAAVLLGGWALVIAGPVMAAGGREAVAAAAVDQPAAQLQLAPGRAQPATTLASVVTGQSFHSFQVDTDHLNGGHRSAAPRPPARPAAAGLHATA